MDRLSHQLVAASGATLFPTFGRIYSPLLGENYGTQEVAYGVVGSNPATYYIGAGQGHVLKSTDLDTWTATVPKQDTFSSTYIIDIEIANGIILVTDGANIYRSTDSNNWTICNISNKPPIITKIAYGNGVWVYTGSQGKLGYSSDGLNFTTVSGTSNLSTTYGNLFFLGGYFLACTSNQTGGDIAVLVSTNGQTWTSTNLTGFHTKSIAYRPGADPHFAAIGFDGILRVAPANISFPTNWYQASTQTGLQSVTWHSGTSEFIAVGNGGRILRGNPNPGSWSSTTINLESGLTNYDLNNIVSNGSYFVITNSSNGIIYHTTSSGIGFAAVAPADGTGLRPNIVRVTAPNVFLITTTWATALTKLEFVSMGGSSFAVLSSDKLIPYNEYGWNSITYDSFRDNFYITNSGTFPDAITIAKPTASGITLTSPYIGGYTVRSVAANANIIVAVGAINTILTSTNGTTWTLRTTGVHSTFGNWYGIGTINTLNKVIWVSDLNLFIAFGTSIMTSPDGITWTIRRSNLGFALTSAVWTGTKIIATGASKIYESTNGTTWTFKENCGRSNKVVDLNDGGLWTCNANLSRTTDGINWTHVEVPGMDIARSTFDLSYMAVAGTKGVFTSINGTSWTERSLDASAVNLRAVAALAFPTGTRWVVVADGGAIFTSDNNGVTWTSRTSGTALNITAIIWAGVRFVAITDGPIVLTSADGITWSTQSVSSSTGFESIAYNPNNNTVIITNRSGSVSTTKDFISTNNGASFSGTNLVYNNWGIISYSYSLNRFVLVKQGVILTSIDGFTWTSLVGGNSYANAYSINYIDGKYVSSWFYGMDYLSNDFTKWIKTPTFKPAAARLSLNNNRLYYEVGDTGATFYSFTSDIQGNTWQWLENIPGFSFAWTGEMWISTGASTNTGIYCSKDGINFSLQNTGSQHSPLFSIAASSNHVLGVTSYTFGAGLAYSKKP